MIIYREESIVCLVATWSVAVYLIYLEVGTILAIRKSYVVRVK